MTTPRRRLLATVAATGTAAATLMGVVGTAPVALAGGRTVLAAPADGAAVRNVIYLLGDGMGRTHVTAARERFTGYDGRLAMEQLPVIGSSSVHSVERGTSFGRSVPDSAATGTAWSTGQRTYNDAISVDTNGRKLTTLMEQAKGAGMRTGNVSTAEITDATPAVMVSHTLVRQCQGPVYTDNSCKKLGGVDISKPDTDPLLLKPIAEQIATNNVADVLLGGGVSRFEPADESAMRSNGYQVLGSFGDPARGTDNGAQTASSQRVATRADLAAVGGRDTKVIGLFNRGNMTVETAKAKAADASPVKQEPSLPEMTGKAIDLLANSSTTKGFLLQVEGASIDKRSHANDAEQTLGEMKAFDDAVAVARDFAQRDGHTLVIVTADHECAGFNIIEKGTFTNSEAYGPPGNTDDPTRCAGAGPNGSDITAGGNSANNSTPTRSFGNSVRADGTQTTSSGGAAPQRNYPVRTFGFINAPSGQTASGDPTTPTGPTAYKDPAFNNAPATFRTADDPAGVVDGTADASLWLSYLSGNHTGADVPVYAGGPQAARFAASQNQTDLYTKMYDALAALGNKPFGPSAPGDPGAQAPGAPAAGAPPASAAPAPPPVTFRVVLHAGKGGYFLGVQSLNGAAVGQRINLVEVMGAGRRSLGTRVVPSRGSITPLLVPLRRGQLRTVFVTVPGAAGRAGGASPFTTLGG